MKTENLIVILIIGFFLVAGTFVYKQQETKPKQEELIQSSPVFPLPKEDEKRKPDLPQPKSSFDEALTLISSKELKSHVYTLASDEFEGRMSGKKGDDLCANYVENYWKKLGLPTVRDKFSIRGGVNPGPNNEQGRSYSENIYTWVEGETDEIVVIGAHRDHIGWGPNYSRSNSRNKIHPGADDNASGTAALLEIARVLKSSPKPLRTIVLQAYSAEEMGLVGSKHYVDEPMFPKDNPSIQKHVFMLNMDMVGYLNRDTTYFVGFNDHSSSIDISRIIDELSGKYQFAKNITGRQSGGSDHANFYNKKIPVASLFTGFHPHYHTPNDTADKINYEGLEKVAKYAAELAWRVANDSSRPSFNYGSFQELPLIHDHGHPGLPFHSYHRHTND